MWNITEELEHAAKEDLAYTKGNVLNPEKQTKQADKQDESEQTLLEEINQQWHEECSERRAENARRVREKNKRMNKHRIKSEEEQKRYYSEDALARMDQRRFNRQIELQGTLTPRQAQVLTDYSNGLRIDVIAMKYRMTKGMVAAHLQNSRFRLCALNNVHAVKVALKLGLIK